MSRNIENTYQYENVYNDFGRQNVTDKQKKKKKIQINRTSTWSTDQCNSTINVKIITNKQRPKKSSQEEKEEDKRFYGEIAGLAALTD